MNARFHFRNGFRFAARRRVWTALTFTCVMMGESFAASPAQFFNPPKNSAPVLDPAGIYPHGQRFGFGLYSVSGNSKIDPKTSNMHRAAENGFTLAGPYYERDWRDFRPIYAAASEGMQFTFQIRPPAALVGVTVDNRPAALNKLSDAEIAATVREQVTAVLNDPIANQTVARWTVSPEELRYWKASEMRYLKVASETIRAVEKERGVAHRPMWMYEPGHRNADALMKTGAEQDIVSKGVYLTDLDRGLARSGYAIWSYSQIVSAAKQLNTVPQAVLQLAADFKDAKSAKNPAEIRRVLRHDAYLGLVMGIKSFNVWSMSENRANLTTHNEQFRGYATVAKDLTGDLDLQKVFLFGEARHDLSIKIANGLKQFDFTDQYGAMHKFDTLHYLNAAVGPDRYLFLVNSTEQPMDVSITGLPSNFLLDDLFKGTTREITQPSLIQRLDVLGVTALRFRQLLALPPIDSEGGGQRSAPEPAAAMLIALATCCGAASFRRRRP